MSELMSSFKLTTYPIVALVLFLGAFLAVCVMIFRKSGRNSLRHAASIPLSDAPTPPCCGRCTQTGGSSAPD